MSQPHPHGVTLGAVVAGAASRVVDWALSSPYSLTWVDASVAAEANLERWASLEGAIPRLLLVDGVPVAYGEVWLEEEESEAELAHLVVDPARRGEGWGCALTRRLADHAANLASDVVLRVDPANTHAQGVYHRCGFLPLPPEQQELFNAGQPHRHLWMRRA